MKKKAKKLVLAKETVRRLGNMTLDKVVGGASDYCNSAVCTEYNSCAAACDPEPFS